MKTRIKNWITSVFGALFMLADVAIIILHVSGVRDAGVLELIGFGLLGWAFLWAKDTLIEGVFLNVFKLKKKCD
jgi:hypothetical protein